MMACTDVDTADMKNNYAEALQKRLNQPFQRRQTFSESEQEALDKSLKFKQGVIDTLKTLHEFTEDFSKIHEKVKPLAPPTFTVHQTAAIVPQNGPQCVCRCLGPTCEGKLTEDLVQKATDVFAVRWKLKDEMSEVAFKGMLVVLEHCLGSELQNHESFQHFVKALGFHTVFFWKKAVPIIYNSDFQYGTNYRDALLFSLALYDVNEGHNRLRELFAAVPGLRDSLMGKHAKRFEESFHHLQQRRSSFSTSNSYQASEADSADVRSSDELDEDMCASSDNSAGTGGKGVIFTAEPLSTVPEAPPLPPPPPPPLTTSRQGSGGEIKVNGHLAPVTESDGEEENEEDAELAEISSKKSSLIP